MKMNPVVHFEMPYEDRERIADFYGKSFGWKCTMFGEDMGNYVVAMTSEEGEDHRPKEVGMINGGFYKKPEDKIGQYTSVVVSVDDIEESMKKVEQAGGKVVNKLENIPGVGLYVSIIDTEGNRISVLQPVMKVWRYEMVEGGEVDNQSAFIIPDSDYNSQMPTQSESSINFSC
jgi:hypothetical protein